MENTVNKFWPGKTFFLGKFFWQNFWQNFGKFFSGIFFSGIFFGQFFQEFFFENFFWQFVLADFQRCASNLPCRRVTTHTQTRSIRRGARLHQHLSTPPRATGGGTSPSSGESTIACSCCSAPFHCEKLGALRTSSPFRRFLAQRFHYFRGLSLSLLA